jgi:hypothetical protein
MDKQDNDKKKKDKRTNELQNTGNCVFLAPIFLDYLALQSFDFESI